MIISNIMLDFGFTRSFSITITAGSMSAISGI